MTPHTSRQLRFVPVKTVQFNFCLTLHASFESVETKDRAQIHRDRQTDVQIYTDRDRQTVTERNSARHMNNILVHDGCDHTRQTLSMQTTVIII